MFYTEGFVRQRNDRKSKPWQGVISYRDADGAKRQKTKTFGPEVRSQAAAMRALREWRFELESAAQAGAGAVPARETALAEYARRYVDGLEAVGAVEPSTVASYRRDLGRLNETGLGGLRLGEVAAGDVQAWVTALAGRGLSSSTVNHAFVILKQIFKHAVQVGDLPKDPSAGVRAPKRDAPRPNSLDAAGRARVLGLLGEMGPVPFKVAALLALLGGLRVGEVCGLRWADVENGRVWVRRSVGRASGGFYLKEPKSGRERDVPASPALAGALAERREQVRAECREAGVAFSNELFVIGNIEGRYADPVSVSAEWTSFAKTYGLVGVTGRRPTFHDLRHTFATALISSNIDIKTVSSLLGHANAAMTLNVYASADPDAKRRAAALVDRAMALPPGVLQFKTAANDA